MTKSQPSFSNMMSGRDSRIFRWSLKVLGWFCKPYYLDVIEGDIIEIYSREIKENPKHARLHMVWNVVRFFRLRFLKDFDEFRLTNSYGMFKNYFKVSLRNMLKQKAYSALNIFGLAIGVTSCLLIIMHISYHLSFDKHVQDVDRIYRVVNDWGSDSYNGWTSPKLVNQLLTDFPEIESGARVMGPWDAIIKKDESYITQDGVLMADSTFFDIFPTTFIAGTAEQALNRPNTVVLTQSVAEKLFPGEEAYGKFLESDDTRYRVSAVVVDAPENTTAPYKAIVNIPHESWAMSGYWTGNNFFSFLKLKENADPVGLTFKFPEFVRKYIAPEMIEFLPQYDSWDDFLEENERSLALIPLLDVHLHQPRLDLGQGGDYDNVIIFSIIAFFILLIACINYINMSTAKSSLRAKEVGMRKVLGSIRGNIMQQFLTESMIITMISVVLGIILAAVILPFFNDLTEMNYTMSNLFAPGIFPWIFGLILVIGLLAGSYPALYLSSFQPIAALKGDIVKGGSRRLRMLLVIFQFAISIILIAGTFIVYQQVSFMSDRELGLNAEQVFVLRNGSNLDEQYDAFRNSLMSNSNILEIGVSNQYPSGFISDWNYQTVGENAISLGPDHMFMDEYAMQALGFELVQGSYFTGKATDTAAVIVNEAFVKAVGWEEPINKLLERGGQEEQYRVIGVVENVVLRSGRRNVRPALYRYHREIESGAVGGPYIQIKVSGDYQAAIQYIEKTWSEFVPGYPFDGFFLDDSFDELYDNERRFGKVFTSFSFLAILIASIGLFALAAFTLERRMKEIAIRKVLGATVKKVVSLIVWDFLKLVLLASIFAVPLIWYLGNNWLENYDYRIDIHPLLMVIPVVVVCLIALITVGYRSLLAATDNPVNALKQE